VYGYLETQSLKAFLIIAKREKEKQLLVVAKYFKNILCDAYRPNHFDGVITVLDRLFSIVNSNKVYFGEKDYQQLKIVEKFIEENYPNLKLISVPTFRTDKNIAFSSRNNNLSKNQLYEFETFHNATLEFVFKLDKDINIEEANVLAKEFIKKQNIEKFDYFEFRNTSSLELEGKISDARLFYAIFRGQNRLIDNIDF